jgi:hypothetical protein
MKQIRWKLTGALKASIGDSSCGEDGAALNAVCGVGGVIGAGTVCDDWVEEGVCNGGG